MDGIICLYKPANMTSHDAITLVKQQLDCKVGHTGTLDPNAEGVLVLLINKATKALPFLDLNDKTYLATCQFGYKTSTGDIWGETVEKGDFSPLSHAEIFAAVRSMQGEYQQKVPMVSAKKINGKKLYEYARKGEIIDTPITLQTIYSIEPLAFDWETNILTFRAKVSSGTYIRSLCEDIALRCHTVGTMASLLREAVGSFTLADCVTLENMANHPSCINVSEKIKLPKVDAVPFLENIRHGKRIVLKNQADEVLFVQDTQAVAVYQREKDSTYRSVRGLW